MVTFVLIIALFLVVDFVTICSYYSESLKASAWHTPIITLTTLTQAACWVLVAKTSKSEQEMYNLFLVLEVLLAISWAFIPIFMFGVKSNSYSYAGVFFLIAGTLLLK